MIDKSLRKTSVQSHLPLTSVHAFLWGLQHCGANLQKKERDHSDDRKLLKPDFIWIQSVLSLLLTVLYRQCSHFRSRFIAHACICFCVWVCLCACDACVWPSLGNSSFCSRVVDQTETSLLLLTKERGRAREREGLHGDLSYLLVRCWIHKRTIWKWL